MKSEDMHIALGLPPPTDGSADPSADADGGDDEQAENDAIDALFDATDPDARREAFKRAVDLCTKDYSGA
jgi:hypothetical protein